MKQMIKGFSILLLCILLSALAATAGPKGNGKGKGKGSHPEGKEARGGGTQVSVNLFVGSDHDRIQRFFVPSTGGLPPGLAKRRGDLPPGLAKQLIRNGHLPPGLEKKLYPFPVELERALPPLEPGLVRGMIGGSAVIFNGNTRVVLDVFTVF